MLIAFGDSCGSVMLYCQEELAIRQPALLLQERLTVHSLRKAWDRYAM
jgi:hypothetical protein